MTMNEWQNFFIKNKLNIYASKDMLRIRDVMCLCYFAMALVLVMSVYYLNCIKCGFL